MCVRWLHQRTAGVEVHPNGSVRCMPKRQILQAMTTPRRPPRAEPLRAAIGLGLGILMLTGCGASAERAATATTPTAVASADEPFFVDTEGSVTTAGGRFVTYPDGLTIRFISATVRPAAVATRDGQYKVPTDSSVVTVRVQYENPSAQPMTPEGQTLHVAGQYGANRFDADGFMAELGLATTDLYDTPKLPTRIGARSKVQIWDSFIVPTAELPSTVAIPFTGIRSPMMPASAERSPYAFTDVAK